MQPAIPLPSYYSSMNLCPLTAMTWSVENGLDTDSLDISPAS